MAHRICIVGTTGSGKTTLAGQLSRQLDIPHVELDALNWGPDWTQATTETLRLRLETALQGNNWVVDGNYGKLRDLSWTRATTVVWLDYSFSVTFRRLFRRTIRRIVTQEKLWGYNRETWRAQFLHKDSLFLWLLKTHGRHRRDYPALMARAEYSHVAFVRLRSPAETARWLANLR